MAMSTLASLNERAADQLHPIDARWKKLLAGSESTRKELSAAHDGYVELCDQT
jgi:hypothetical protein